MYTDKKHPQVRITLSEKQANKLTAALRCAELNTTFISDPTNTDAATLGAFIASKLELTVNDVIVENTSYGTIVLTANAVERVETLIKKHDDPHATISEFLLVLVTKPTTAIAA